MEEFICEVGKQKSQVVTIENPTEEVLELVAKNSNPINFAVASDQITVYPYGKSFPAKRIIISSKNFFSFSRQINIFHIGSTEIQIFYKPTALDRNDSGTLTFTSNALGDWTYNLYGHGVLPTVMDSIIVTSIRGK